MPRIVVVTGASGGIGRATAVAFGARGDTVALLARGEAGLAGAKRDVEAAGGTALVIPTDVADSDAGVRRRGRVETELGPIDVWVNVAFTSVFAPFEKITPEEYRRVTEVSYLGYVYATMAALKHMKPRDRGTIVQVGSALAYRGIPLQTAYCGAKHAIQGFHEALRCELLHDKQQRARHDGPDAGRQHSTVLLGAVAAAQSRPARAADLSARVRRPSCHSSPLTTHAAASTGSEPHDGHARCQRDRSRPARSLPRPDRDQVPTDRRISGSPARRRTCGIRPTDPTGATSARMASSTAKPTPGTCSSGPHNITAYSGPLSAGSALPRGRCCGPGADDGPDRDSRCSSVRLRTLPDRRSAAGRPRRYDWRGRR